MFNISMGMKGLANELFIVNFLKQFKALLCLIMTIIMQFQQKSFNQ